MATVQPSQLCVAPLLHSLAAQTDSPNSGFEMEVSRWSLASCPANPGVLRPLLPPKKCQHGGAGAQ